TRVGSARACVIPHAELQLPALVALRAHAPELEHAYLGEPRLEADGRVAFLEGVVGWQRGFERIGFGEFFWRPARQQIAWLVVFAGGRAEEAEVGGLADHQADLAGGDVDLRPFLHAVRHYTQGPQRPG